MNALKERGPLGRNPMDDQEIMPSKLTGRVCLLRWGVCLGIGLGLIVYLAVTTGAFIATFRPGNR